MTLVVPDPFATTNTRVSHKDTPQGMWSQGGEPSSAGGGRALVVEQRAGLRVEMDGWLVAWVFFCVAVVAVAVVLLFKF